MGGLLVYLAIVAFGVFGPSPGLLIRDAGEAARSVVYPVLRRVSDEVGVRPKVRPYVAGWSDEAIANAGMFVILGLVFPVVVARWRWLTVPLAVLLSVAIETVQLLFLPWRTPSLQDIAWNSVGAAIGFLIWSFGWACWHWGSTRRKTST